MKTAVAGKDRRRRTMISSPVPTVEQTAAKLGVGSRRVRQLERMMDRIARRRSGRGDRPKKKVAVRQSS